MLLGLLATVALADTTSAQPAPAPHIYLKGAESRRACGKADDAGEILVCGQSDGQPVSTSPDQAVPDGLPRAATKVFGDGTVALRADGKGLPGAVSNRAMVTLTVPLR